MNLFAAILCLSASIASAADKPKIVLLAGKKSHGPVGNGIHDYGWSVKLLHAALEASNIKDKVVVEHHEGGWPNSSKAIDGAATIVVISDGRDGDLYSEAIHLESPQRVRYVDELMKKGCGFVAIHFSNFAAEAQSKQVLDWSGGHFSWEKNGKRDWESAITTKESEILLPTPNHPVVRGLKPFRMRDEFYYNLRLAADSTPILEAPALNGRAPNGNVVAWAKERPGGGRGFGTTCGHFYDNWRNDSFRKTVLNAICWTAKVEVPEGGVEAPYFTADEIERRLKPPDSEMIRVLLLAGNDAHRWHNWEKTTPAIIKALEIDPRIKAGVTNDPEDFGKGKLKACDVLLLNYCNWHDSKPLSEPSRKAVSEFVRGGGGMVAVHFANGAFHFSLPMAGGSDWPEYRTFVRRVWNHQKSDSLPPSAHDNFGKFTAFPTGEHPIVKGLQRFELIDELYFNQHGTERIEPMLLAHSQITKKLEPLAWAHEADKGRVFQILLGHSEKTWDVFEPREMLRRAVAWTAKRELKPMMKDGFEAAVVK
jgi:type 1 glutamine amidotransferase